MEIIIKDQSGWGFIPRNNDSSDANGSGVSALDSNEEKNSELSFVDRTMGKNGGKNDRL